MNVLSKGQLKELSKKIEELNTATSNGRIPRKIGTNHGSLQQKNERIEL